MRACVSVCVCMRLVLQPPWTRLLIERVLFCGACTCLFPSPETLIERAWPSTAPDPGGSDDEWNVA